ncbi:DNA helicase IV [Vibrio sp. SM6]|uniref:DNA 3'-5' helicase n=1 Tax=Vibrio agarilyticus TaxID=2726741 RepID=A0A7X8TRB5_9VIBR|nr:DNA helicase IV [Vibrio agarilyticus]NLS13401.1 DNA helicase IV [Vibrio agarilyticus]
MMLSANRTAQFFIQNEYFQVECRDNLLVLSSHTSEERIPFSVWNGTVAIHRGIFWANLQFFAFEEDGEQRSWLVQGLPWHECRHFAKQAVECYQHWHNAQSRQLSQCLPRWQESLTELENSTVFLKHSQINAWTDMVTSDLESIGMTFDDAHLFFPNQLHSLTPWVANSSQALCERNHHWLEREKHHWQNLFRHIESSPLNDSQQHAVMLNDDHNLVLAGAGSGKTSVLTARVAYLLESQQAYADSLLLLAFGRDAANEMRERLNLKVGPSARDASVLTFHQLGLNIIRQVEGQKVELSPLALDETQRHSWCSDWLKRHWMTPTNFKRWQKHLSQWPIAYLSGDDELGCHVENPKLIAWLDAQLQQLAQLGYSKKQLQEKLVDSPEYTRLNSELALCWPCFRDWQKLLKESNQIDFPMMISRATQYVKNGKFHSPWRFIMVDEYQDISPDRLALVEALCGDEQTSHHASLFAVGDDWQAIYQFAGADVDLTTEFTQRFALATVHYLDTTYRFPSTLGAVANQFVQQNPQQVKKSLLSFKQLKQKTVLVAPNSHLEKYLDELNRKANDQRDAAEDSAIERENNAKRASVLILGRNHYHKPNLLEDWQKRFTKLTIEFATCHASKGREADYVFIVNVDEGQFPAKVKKRHLNNALTQGSDAFPYAEERRLFYVALTRAKRKVWVLHTGAGSVFVKELLSDGYEVQKITR